MLKERTLNINTTVTPWRAEKQKMTKNPIAYVIIIIMNIHIRSLPCLSTYQGQAGATIRKEDGKDFFFMLISGDAEEGLKNEPVVGAVVAAAVPSPAVHARAGSGP